MKKSIGILIVAVISMLGLYACELFGFQRATLKIKNIPEIQEAYAEQQKKNGESSIYSIKLDSDNINIVDNRGDTFDIDLAEMNTWSHSLEWFGYSDGIFKLKISYMGTLVITTDSYRIQFGDILTISTLDLFQNIQEENP